MLEYAQPDNSRQDNAGYNVFTVVRGNESLVARPHCSHLTYACTQVLSTLILYQLVILIRSVWSFVFHFLD